jgi:hypothetical protein
MDRTAPHSARTDAPASPQESRSSAAMPTCIAALLSVVRVLLGYGKHLDATLPDRTDHPGFPAIAIGFGTHDLRRILAHVQRGILRAMMLQQYLLARAAQGRDIEPTERPVPAEQADIEGLEMKLRPPAQSRAKAKKTHPDDPLNFSMPTLRELESQVRRRSIGRTIAEISMDLGVTPSSCEGGFWNEFFLTLTDFGGKFEEFFEVQERRSQTFKKERDKRPSTGNWDWCDRPKEAIRQLLGYLLGEPPPRGPPIPQLLIAAV